MVSIEKALTKLRTGKKLLQRGVTMWRGAVLAVIAAGILLAFYWPVQAAMELLYFRAESTNTSVLLSWATAREIDVEGYLILCKMDGQPDSEYHWIGQLAAMGGPDQAAQYDFAVTEDVYYGEKYCFRLEEVTTNDEPGEKRDICGYGPGVTPTPVVAGTGLDLLGSPTPVVIVPVPGQSSAPTLLPTGPTPTWTPIGQSPIATPTFDPLATSTSTQFVSPLGVVDATQQAAASGMVGETTPSPTPTWTPTASPSPTQPISPLGAPAEAATATPTETPTPTPTVASAAGPGGGGTGAQLDQSLAIAGQAGPTPTALYIVVTATPTPVAMAVVPTLTAWPTVTVAPDLGVLGILDPSAQSMMVMMLCLIFLSATGLGTLGLVTAVLYFRSQSQRRDDGNIYVDRRRF